MKRRGFACVVLLTLVVTFGGAAGMYAIEKGNQGFENYGMALWWTAMRVITAGSDFWPSTPEGRGLAFILSLFWIRHLWICYSNIGYFLHRDAEESNAPVAGAKDVQELKKMIDLLNQKIDELNNP